MFFTVIVPTYNPKRFLDRLLNSIKANFCYRTDIEIILSDDLSTEPFEDELRRFPDMKIRVIKNDKHYGYPRWGRQHGLEEAKGDWICFCDQDDEFCDHAFDTMKKTILHHGLHNYLVTNFYLQPEGKSKAERVQMQKTLNWTHGKFYERKFIEANNIAYDEVRYCEDINFSSVVDLALHKINTEVIFVDTYTYIWNQRADSLSKNNNYREYFFQSFPEYIDGTIGVYIKAYEQDPNASQAMRDFYEQRIEQTFYYYYFYFQGMINPQHECPPIPDNYYEKIANYFYRYKKCIHMTTDEYLDMTYKDKITMFAETRNIAVTQIPFMEYEGYTEWIKNRIVPFEPKE